MEASNSKKMHWLYIPLGLIIFMCMGTIYSWSVFRKPLESVFEISATLSGMPYMLFLVFYALSMPVAGGFIDKLGPRVITIIGGLVISLGWFLSSFATNIYFLMLTYGVLAGVGVGIAYGAPMAVAAKWFPEKKGLAVGLTLGGFGLSPFVTAPLANKLVESIGPFETFKILGIAFGVIITLLALPLKFPKRHEKNDFDTKSTEVNIKTKDMLKTKSFYGLWSVYTIGTLVGLMAIGISSPVAEEIIKLDSQKAAMMVSFFALFNGVGRPIFGSLTDKFSPKKTAIFFFFFIIFISLIMLYVSKGQTILYGLAFAIFWLNLGGWLAIAPTATGQFFGSKYYSKNYGYLFTAYGAGAVLGNVLSGKIRDVFGSYRYVFYPTIAFAILGIIISIIYVKKPKTEN